ncbi:MAG TPA: molybdate ABC transporter permease subunit, partial [Acidimicrobiia bacterium]|nr:molybdate ABC transporter permease subunit [Acidimicrobiia bacterium]
MRKSRERPPLLALSAGLVAALFFILPLAGLLWRAPWRAVPADLGSPDVRTALRLSLETSLAAVGLCLAFGLPLAWVLARVPFPGRRLVRAMVVLPMVLPPVVGGIALINAFGRRGLVGQYLDRWFHITLPFTTKGAILAEAFVAMP